MTVKDMLTENRVFLAAQTEEVKPRSNFAALKFLAPVNIEPGFFKSAMFLYSLILIFSYKS